MEVTIRDAALDDIDSIGALAHEIWPAVYGQLISAEQLEYMLDLFYSPEALAKQMAEGHRFLIAFCDGKPVGFASFSSLFDTHYYKLHKLYILPQMHGKGLGRNFISVISGEILMAEGVSLLLNVNRFNPARHFYERLGFKILKEEVKDIGHGFVMDDYVMEKIIVPGD